MNCIETLQTLTDDECESSNIASQKEIISNSGNTNLNHTRYTHLSATKQTVNLAVTDTKNITGIIGDGMGIK